MRETLIRNTKISWKEISEFCETYQQKEREEKTVKGHQRLLFYEFIHQMSHPLGLAAIRDHEKSSGEPKDTQLKMGHRQQGNYR